MPGTWIVFGEERDRAPNEVLASPADAPIGAFGLARIRPRVDPYLEWAVLTGFIDPGGPPRWMPLLIRARGITAKDFARGEWGFVDVAVRRVPPPGWQAWCAIPDWYASPPSGLEDATWFTARVTPEFFVQLGAPKSTLADVVDRFAFGWSPGGPLVGATAAGTQFAPGATASRGAVAVGVIDDGVAFAHRRFRAADGRSRVEAFWDQREPHGERPVTAAPWPSPGGPVPYGHETPRVGAGAVPGIDDLLEAATTGGSIVDGLLDEDAVYRAAGQQEAGRRGRHGTHVMDVACGAEPGDSAGAPAIVAVQLPRAVALDTAGHLLAPHVVDGLRFILDRAERRSKDATLGGPMPVVVNLSYGIHAGPHDGSSPLERAMDEMIRHRRDAGAPLAIVIPAGNSQLARCHATFAMISAAQVESLSWHVQPDHPATTFMEIWLPRAAAGVDPNVKLTLVPPDGPASKVDVVRYQTAVLVDGAWNKNAGALDPARVMATVSYREATKAPGNPSSGASYYAERDMILVSIAPTRRTGGARAVAPAGAWTVRLENLGTANCRVEAWIERTDAPYGFSRTGPQSRFDEPAYRVYDHVGRPIETDPANPGILRREMSINGIATGDETIVVGASIADVRGPSRYASSGPRIAPAGAAVSGREGADVAAVADDAAVHRGVIAAGTRAAGAVVLNGSSVAAPAVTRRIAARMAEGESVDRASVGALVTYAYQPVDPPSPDWTRRRIGAGLFATERSGRPDRMTGRRS
jgi:hypothetical protein